MGGLELGALSIAGVILLVALRIPVALSMVAVALAGMWLAKGSKFALLQLQIVPFSVVDNYAFVVVPMFILMGALISATGVVKALYDSCLLWLALVRGSLYYATVIGSTLFAAISGSTIVNSAMFTRIALPEMIRLNYNRALAAGCIAGVGTLAALIPPSLSFIIYGILTGQSIGQLLIAGVIPGLLTAVLFLVTIFVALWIRPSWAPDRLQLAPIKERISSLRSIWPVLLLVSIVLGGIYSGIVPPSAAGAIGVMGAIIITLIQRSFTIRKFIESVDSTLIMTAAIFFIVIGGTLFSRFLISIGFVSEVNGMVLDLAISPTVFMLVLIALYLVLGMFVDPISMMVMTLPILFPVSQALGIDPIWFGVIVVKLVEIAVISPPVGMNLFAVVSASEGQVKSREVFVGILPFVIAEAIGLAILFAFPALATFLPRTMI